MKKSNKLKIFFTLAIIEMLVVASYFGYMGYGIITKSKELHKQTTILQEKTALAQVSNDLREQKLQLEKKIEEAKLGFFDDESLMAFLKSFNSIANAYGLTINSISFSGLTVGANVKPPIMLLPISVSITGNSYDGFVNFLSYLEKKGYTIKPNTVSVSSTISSMRSTPKAKGTSISASFTIYVQTTSTGKWSYKKANNP